MNHVSRNKERRVQLENSDQQIAGIAFVSSDSPMANIVGAKQPRRLRLLTNQPVVMLNFRIRYIS
ncbi:MAG: hypothetical protein KME57_06355 [Scytonema hyalinum WJT4-NPBG1]|nr:hypothetical protein [Scytonema hyalinum WJT4-NPBG1]